MTLRFVLKEKPLFRPPSGGESPGAELRSDTPRVSSNPKCFQNLNLLNNGVSLTPFVFLKALDENSVEEFVCVA